MSRPDATGSAAASREPGVVMVATATLGAAIGVLVLGIVVRCGLVYGQAVSQGDAVRLLSIVAIDSLLALLLAGAFALLRRRKRGVRMALAWLVPVLGLSALVLGPDVFAGAAAALVLVSAVLVRMKSAASWF